MTLEGVQFARKERGRGERGEGGILVAAEDSSSWRKREEVV